MINLEERAEIREFIRQQYDKLKEGSTTANIASYETPQAFTGDEDDEGTQAINLEDEQYAYSIEAPKKRKNSVKLHEVSYKNFKKDEGASTIQKINRNILEVNKRIREMSQMLNHSIKLKTEQNLDGSIHWKKTNEALAKMHNRITTLSERANQLYNLNEATANSVKTFLVNVLKDAGLTIRPEDVDYETAGADHYEFDVMIDGEPHAIDYNKGELVYMAYDKEMPLGTMELEQQVVDNLTKIFK